MRSRAQVMVVGTAAVLLAGCTGGDADPAPDPDPSATSSTTVAGPSLCEVLTPEDLDRFSDGRTPRSDLMLGNEGFLGCDTDGLSSFEFGVQVVDDGRELSELLAGEPEEVPGLGDEAFRVRDEMGGDLLGETLVVRVGDRTVYVRNQLLQYGDERATEQDTVDVATQLLDQGATALIDSIRPIEVSDPCPSVADVAEVVGDVELARAQTVGDEVECHYLGADGVRFQADRFSSDAPADFLGTGDPVELDGADEASIRADDSTIELTAVSGEQVLTIGTAAVGADPRASADRAAFDRLAASLAPALLQ